MRWPSFAKRIGNLGLWLLGDVGSAKPVLRVDGGAGASGPNIQLNLGTGQTGDFVDVLSGGLVVAKIDASGNLTCQNITAANIANVGGLSLVNTFGGSSIWDCSITKISNSTFLHIESGQVSMANNAPIAWSSNGTWFGTLDTVWSRVSAGVLKVANGSGINAALQIGNSTISSLPAASGLTGSIGYASNGRKSGEGAGSGTGIPVWCDGTNWRTFYDNTIAAA